MLKDFFLSMKEDPKRRKKWIYGIIAILVLYFVLFSDSGVITRFSLESEKTELKEKISKAKKETDSLKHRIDELKTNELEIERVAREKYGMKKKGETIYIIEDDSENKQE
jgi:cell division protein DivIC